MSKQNYSLIGREDQFIRDCINQYGYRLNEEESLSEAWVAFLEAQHTYHQFEGCCSFSAYAAVCIEEKLETMRRKRNERITLESDLSLDQSIPNSNETVGQLYFNKHDDFTSSVILWRFIEKMGKQKYEILRLMDHNYSHNEIMQQCGICSSEYAQLLEEIRESFRLWQRI